uniref:Uncharacterized protein n=1 Tax=Guillardia theta TaxID=55529 RepID=A0A7S4KAH9_GUITH|mmetsp:Transcript_22384/g.73521  ORF Transcript_22384/g.73521 Transcript_22384/m.73521 type:complete len:247 (+) Transcript_22384:240-980(+)
MGVKISWRRRAILLLIAAVLVRPSLGHEKGVNVCSPDEDRPTKRSACTQDSSCKHETQCGCIPKGCNCGDFHCILNLHPHSHGDGQHAEISSSKLQGGSNHIHKDGTTHSHSGGSKPHHHMSDGTVVYEPDTNDPHNEPVDADKARSRSMRVGTMGSAGNATNPTDSKTHKQKTWGLLMFLVAGAVGCMVMSGVYMIVAPFFTRCFRRRVLGKSMLSKDMFDDKEMLAMDWESKANAAGWSRDDDL